MKPISEGLESLQVGTKVGLSTKGAYSNDQEWHIVAAATIQSKPKGFVPNAVVVVLEKVYLGKDSHNKVSVGDIYLTFPEHLYTSTDVCSECRGEGEQVHGQEGKGYHYSCEHCGGTGLEPLTEGRRMDIPKDAVCFRSNETEEMFICGAILAKPLLYSSDGVMFFELLRTGFGGSSTKHSVHFDDPHHDRKSFLERDEDTLIWEGKTFKQVECPSSVKITPLPMVRVPEYLFELEDGTLIYVSANKYHYTYQSFRAFIGLPNELKNVPVLDVERYSDGGTTYVTTTEGNLFSPAPIDKEKRPAWNGKEIKALDSGKFVIEETDEVVKIYPQ